MADLIYLEIKFIFLMDMKIHDYQFVFMYEQLFNFEHILTVLMIKNILERRKESGAYLATDGRHRWSLKMTMKNDNYM